MAVWQKQQPIRGLKRGENDGAALSKAVIVFVVNHEMIFVFSNRRQSKLFLRVKKIMLDRIPMQIPYLPSGMLNCAWVDS